MLNETGQLEARVRAIQEGAQSVEAELRVQDLLRHYFLERVRKADYLGIIAIARSSSNEMVVFHCLNSLCLLLAPRVVVLGSAVIDAIEELLAQLLMGIDRQPKVLFNLVLTLSGRFLARFLPPAKVRSALEHLERSCAEENYKFWVTLLLFENIIGEHSQYRGLRLRTRAIEFLPDQLFSAGFRGLGLILQKIHQESGAPRCSARFSDSSLDSEAGDCEELREIEAVLESIPEGQLSPESDLATLVRESLELMQRCMLFDFYNCREEEEIDEFLLERSPLILPSKGRPGCGFGRIKTNTFVRVLHKLLAIFKDEQTTFALIRILGETMRITMRFFKSMSNFVAHMEVCCFLVSKTIEQLRDSLHMSGAQGVLPELLSTCAKGLQAFEPKVYVESEVLCEWLDSTLNLCWRCAEARLLSPPVVRPALEILSRTMLFSKQTGPDVSARGKKAEEVFSLLAEMVTQSHAFKSDLPDGLRLEDILHSAKALPQAVCSITIDYF